MVESVESVKNIDEIVAVPGIGAIFIGPHDLSMSMGKGTPQARGTARPWSAEVESAIQTVLSACKKHNVICGISADAGGRPEVERRIREGFKVILGPAE